MFAPPTPRRPSTGADTPVKPKNLGTNINKRSPGKKHSGVINNVTTGSLRSKQSGATSKSPTKKISVTQKEISNKSSKATTAEAQSSLSNVNTNQSKSSIATTSASKTSEIQQTGATTKLQYQKTQAVAVNPQNLNQNQVQMQNPTQPPKYSEPNFLFPGPLLSLGNNVTKKASLHPNSSNQQQLYPVVQVTQNQLQQQGPYLSRNTQLLAEGSFSEPVEIDNVTGELQVQKTTIKDTNSWEEMKNVRGKNGYILGLGMNNKVGNLGPVPKLNLDGMMKFDTNSTFQNQQQDFVNQSQTQQQQQTVTSYRAPLTARPYHHQHNFASLPGSTVTQTAPSQGFSSFATNTGSLNMNSLLSPRFQNHSVHSAKIVDSNATLTDPTQNQNQIQESKNQFNHLMNKLSIGGVNKYTELGIEGDKRILMDMARKNQSKFLLNMMDSRKEAILGSLGGGQGTGGESRIDLDIPRSLVQEEPHPQQSIKEENEISKKSKRSKSSTKSKSFKRPPGQKSVADHSTAASRNKVRASSVGLSVSNNGEVADNHTSDRMAHIMNNIEDNNNMIYVNDTVKVVNTRHSIGHTPQKVKSKETSSPKKSGTNANGNNKKKTKRSRSAESDAKTSDSNINHINENLTNQTSKTTTTAAASKNSANTGNQYSSNETPFDNQTNISSQFNQGTSKDTNVTAFLGPNGPGPQNLSKNSNVESNYSESFYNNTVNTIPTLPPTSKNTINIVKGKDFFGTLNTSEFGQIPEEAEQPPTTFTGFQSPPKPTSSSSLLFSNAASQAASKFQSFLKEPGSSLIMNKMDKNNLVVYSTNPQNVNGPGPQVQAQVSNPAQVPTIVPMISPRNSNNLNLNVNHNGPKVSPPQLTRQLSPPKGSTISIGHNIFPQNHGPSQTGHCQQQQDYNYNYSLSQVGSQATLEAAHAGGPFSINMTMSPSGYNNNNTVSFNPLPRTNMGGQNQNQIGMNHNINHSCTVFNDTQQYQEQTVNVNDINQNVLSRQGSKSSSHGSNSFSQSVKSLHSGNQGNNSSSSGNGSLLLSKSDLVSASVSGSGTGSGSGSGSGVNGKSFHKSQSQGTSNSNSNSRSAGQSHNTNSRGNTSSQKNNSHSQSQNNSHSQSGANNTVTVLQNMTASIPTINNVTQPPPGPPIPHNFNYYKDQNNQVQHNKNQINNNTIINPSSYALNYISDSMDRRQKAIQQVGLPEPQEPERHLENMLNLMLSPRDLSLRVYGGSPSRLKPPGGKRARSCNHGSGHKSSKFKVPERPKEEWNNDTKVDTVTNNMDSSDVNSRKNSKNSINLNMGTNQINQNLKSQEPNNLSLIMPQSARRQSQSQSRQQQQFSSRHASPSAFQNKNMNANGRKSIRQGSRHASPAPPVNINGGKKKVQKNNQIQNQSQSQQCHADSTKTINQGPVTQQMPMATNHGQCHNPFYPSEFVGNSDSNANGMNQNYMNNTPNQNFNNNHITQYQQSQLPTNTTTTDPPSKVFTSFTQICDHFGAAKRNDSAKQKNLQFHNNTNSYHAMTMGRPNVPSKGVGGSPYMAANMIGNQGFSGVICGSGGSGSARGGGGGYITSWGESVKFQSSKNQNQVPKLSPRPGNSIPEHQRKWGRPM